LTSFLDGTDVAAIEERERDRRRRYSYLQRLGNEARKLRASGRL